MAATRLHDTSAPAVFQIPKHKGEEEYGEHHDDSILADLFSAVDHGDGQSKNQGHEASVLVAAQARRMGVLVTDLRKLADLSSAPMERELVDLEEAARDAFRGIRA